MWDKQKFLEEKLPELIPLVGKIKIVAFTGRMKTGKSLCCNYLVKEAPIFKKKSFAEPLKIAFCNKNRIDRKQLDDPIYKEEFRFEIQRFSEEYLNKDPFHFVKLAFKDTKEGDYLAFDDLRYLQTEFLTIAALEGLPYQMYSDDSQRIKRGWKPNKETDNHQSETDLDLPANIFSQYGGCRIYNNRSIDHVEKEIFNLIVRKMI